MSRRWVLGVAIVTAALVVCWPQGAVAIDHGPILTHGGPGIGPGSPDTDPGDPDNPLVDRVVIGEGKPDVSNGADDVRQAETVDWLSWMLRVLMRRSLWFY